MPRSIVLRRVSNLFSAVAILAIALFSASAAHAQVAGATLSGTVTDPSGAAIASADVAITNTATGVTRLVTTDPAGYYSSTNLLPGNYEVTVKAKGFSTTKESGIGLEVGAQQVLNVVPEFVRQDVSLRELTGRSKSALQFIVEA